MEQLTPGELSTGTTVLLALISTLVLAALHLLTPRIRKLPLVPEDATASFAGGIAVSYVFLHLLPELAEGHIILREMFGEEAPSALTEVGIFLVALVGFSLFYGLERLAEHSRRTPSRADPDGANHAVFWVHLGSFLLYNYVITYTLPLTYQTGWPLPSCSRWPWGCTSSCPTGVWKSTTGRCSTAGCRAFCSPGLWWSGGRSPLLSHRRTRSPSRY